MKKALSLVLVLVMLVGLLPQIGLSPSAEKLDPVDAGLAGKKISILGDSISTMAGISNNTEYNSTIGGNAMYYSGTNHGVTLADTWWQQAIDALGMELCVSNAWSGSCIYDPTPKASTAYVDRCVQLHNDHTGEVPDIIAIYLGTNDTSDSKNAAVLGKASDIDYDTLIVEGADGYTYATPVTVSEAYAIMLHKIAQRYPDAEVYCFTLVSRNTFNDQIRTIAEHFGANVVDLFQNSGIITKGYYDSYYMDGWHPKANGMDAMTNCFLSSIYENSRYITADTHSITYNLTNVWVDQGTAYAVLDGSAFACSFTASNGILPEVTVIMDGKDITDTCYADGKITIDSVTGDIAIQAKAHNHSYTSVVTDPTCAKDGYTTHTCGCGYSYADNYVDATEAHNYVDGVCVGCGLDGFVVHKQGNVRTYYKDLDEALAVVTGGTIKLLGDATTGNLILNRDMILDLNGYTLTADFVVAANGATILDGGAACTGGGILKIQKENLGFVRENGQGVIPVWNGVDGYVFTKVSFQQMTISKKGGVAQYIFLPNFTNPQAAALLADGGADNDLKMKVGLTWNNGQCQQFYTYGDDLVEQVFASGGRLVFSLTVTGIATIQDMVVSAIIVTDSGAQAASVATEITSLNAFHVLQNEMGHMLLD